MLKTSPNYEGLFANSKTMNFPSFVKEYNELVNDLEQRSSTLPYRFYAPRSAQRRFFSAMSNKPTNDHLPLLAGIIGTIIAMLIFSFVLSSSITVNRIHQSAVKNCNQIELIKTQIRRAVATSDSTISSITYYKTHPAELYQAHRLNQQTLQAFAFHPCS